MGRFFFQIIVIVPAGSSASPSALNRVTKIIKMKVVDKKDRFRQWDCEKEEEKKDDQRKTIKSGELFDERNSKKFAQWIFIAYEEVWTLLTMTVGGVSQSINLSLTIFAFKLLIAQLMGVIPNRSHECDRYCQESSHSPSKCLDWRRRKGLEYWWTW